MLLDVNVLLALAWPNHQFHEAAHAWLNDHLPRPWHSCAVTQLGLVRLSCNPAFTESAVSPAEATELAHRLTGQAEHRFIESMPSPTRDLACWQDVAGHRQTTDAYLVMVARANETKLVSFDRRIAANPKLAPFVEVLSPDASG